MVSLIVFTIVGVLIAVVVGMFWYSPGTPMGKIHMEYLGFNKLSKEEQIQKMEEAKPAMPKIYGAQMLLSLLISFAVVFIITTSMKNGVPFSMAVGFPIMSWFCFMVPAIGTGILWSNCDRKITWGKFISDSLYQLVVILLIAGVVGIFA